MAPSRLVPVPALLVLALLLAACGSASPARSSGATTTARARLASATRARVVTVVAAGDIACPPGLPVTPTQCQEGATARLAAKLGPSLVLPLGDTQYDNGTLADYRTSYAKTWGALLAKSRPTIGNHEYLTPGARGYYTYFRNRQPGAPGYYRVRAGAWQIFVLNSNCDKVSCGREATWLNRQMSAHPSRCSMVTMHHPRYSSGSEHGNDAAVIPLWRVAYRHRADLVLSGHDHNYERFQRMDAIGHLRPSRGLLEIVVGTGGRNLRPLGTRTHGSAYFEADRFGVLRLDLGPRRYSWALRTTDGRALDAGSRTCL